MDSKAEMSRGLEGDESILVVSNVLVGAGWLGLTQLGTYGGMRRPIITSVCS